MKYKRNINININISETFLKNSNLKIINLQELSLSIKFHTETFNL